MQKNKNHFEIGERRVIWQEGAEGLKNVLESSKENIHPKEDNETDFKKERENDKRDPEDKSAEDTHEKSKEALNFLLQKDAVKKLTKKQLDELKVEIEEISKIDADAALETSEIGEVEKAVDELNSKDVSSLSEQEVMGAIKLEDKKELPREKSWIKTEAATKDDDYFNRFEENKSLVSDFLKAGEKNGKQEAKKEEETYETIDELIQKSKTNFDSLGISLNESNFKKAIGNIINWYVLENYKKENEFKNIVEELEGKVNRSKGWDFTWLSKLVGGIGFNSDLVKAKDISDVLETEITDKLKKSFEDINKIEISDELKGKMPEMLKKIDAGLIKDGELQPFVIEYIIAGNYLRENLKKVIIVEEWKTTEPQLDAFATKFGIEINKDVKIKFLQILSTKEINDLTKSSERMEKLISSLKKLETEFAGAGKSKIDIGEIKIGEKDLIKDEKLNLENFVSLNETEVAEFSKKIDTLAKKINDLKKVAKDAIEIGNAKLADFGGKIEADGFEQEVVTKILAKKNISELLKNPGELDQIVIDLVKKKFGLEDLTAIKDIASAIEKKTNNFLGSVESKLVETISDPNFEIDGVKINLKAEDLKKILPNVKKQILPLLAEFFAKHKEYCAEDKKLLENGKIDLDVFEKILNNAEMKKVLSLFEKSEGNIEKVNAEITKSGNVEGSDAKTTVDLIGKLGKFVINPEDQTPAVKTIQDEVLSIVPFDVKIKIGFEKLSSTWDKAMQKIEEKGFLGALGEVFALIVPAFMKMMEDLGSWWDDFRGKSGKTIKKASDYAAKKGWIAPETKTLVDGALESDKTPEQKEQATETAIKTFFASEKVNAKELKYISTAELIAADGDAKLTAITNKQDVNWTEANLKKLREKLLASQITETEKVDTNSVFDLIAGKPDYLK